MGVKWGGSGRGMEWEWRWDRVGVEVGWGRSIRGANMGENMFKTIKKKKGRTKLPTSASFVITVHAVCAVAGHWGRVVVCVGVALLFALGSRRHPHRHRVAACAGVASSPLALGCVAVRAGVTLPFALVSSFVLVCHRSH